MPDVLVVGAGPTGLATACALRLAGVGVRVVDRAPGPATTSRANFLHARGSEVLDRLGALGTLPDEARRAMQITTYLGDRPMMRLRFGDPGLRTAGPPMVISQARVEGELRRRLAELGVEPEWGAALERATQDDGGVTAELGTGETVHAAWLVGCDGTGSTVREIAGITAPGVRLSERFLIADIHLDWDLDRSGTTGWVHPAGMLGAMPMPRASDEPGAPDDLWRVLAYDPGNDPGRRLTQEEILDRIREILPIRTGRRDIGFGRATWLSEFTIHRRLADRYRAGRILLAGDAAHAHAPFGGQGMLTGLGDAENLAWKLALVVRGRAGDPLLDTYEAERRPLASEVLRGTSATTRMNVTGSAFGRFLRDRVIMRAFTIGAVQRWVTFTTSQLWVSYRGGPLGTGLRGRLAGRPRPGDRVGDLACTHRDGSPTRLHAELGGRWAVLTPSGGGVALDPGVPASALDGKFIVLRRTDGRDDTWLIRPDGHLAWRGTDPAAMARWLDGALHLERSR